MRALCGASITAAALIGLGLTAIAFGTRYGHLVSLDRDTQGHVVQLHLADMDRPLVFVLVFLTCMTIIGLGITILGLAYHHHRRMHEMHHAHGLLSGSSTPAATSFQPRP